MTEFWPKKVFHTFLYDDCEWEARCLYTYKYYLTNNWLKIIYRLLLKYALNVPVEGPQSFPCLSATYLGSHHQRHGIASFCQALWYLLETYAFLFQLVILLITPVIIGSLFDLITCNFWILNRINAVFSDPLSPIHFEFIDHWLRHWNIFVEIGVFCSRYIRSKFLYKKKRMTFLPSNTNFLLKRAIRVSIASDVIQYLGFQK